MNFQRTRRTVEFLEKKDKLSIADTLGILNDVLGDVQDTYGISVDKLELGELRDVITRMSSLGRVLLQINRSKEAEISTAAERKKKLDKLCQDISDMGNNLEEYEAIIEKTQQKREELESERIRLAEKSTEFMRINEECESIKIDIENLKNVDMVSAQKRLNQLKKSFNADSEIYNALLDEINSKTAEYQILTQDISDKKDELDKLQKLLEDEYSTAESLSDDCAKITAEIQEIEKKIQEIENERLLSQKRNEELTEKLTKLKEESNTLIDSILPQAEKELEELRKEYYARQKKYENLKTEISAKEAEIAEINLKLADDQTKLERLNREKSEVQEKSDTLKSDIDKTEREISMLKAEMMSVEKQIDNFNNEIRRYRDVEIPAARITLNSRQKTLDEYAEKCANIKIENAAKEEALIKLKEEYDGYVDRRDELDSKKEKAEKNIEELKAENENILLQISQLDQESQRIMNDINSKREQLGISDMDELKKKYEEICLELEREQAECQELREKLSEGEAQKATVQKETDELTGKVDLLNSEIAMRQKKIEELRNQHNALVKKSENMEKEHRKLSEALSQLESDRHNVNLKIFEGEIEVMQEAIDKLFPEVSFAALTLFEQKELIQSKSKYFKDEIQKIRNLLDNYKKEYQTVVKAIEGGTTRYEM